MNNNQKKILLLLLVCLLWLSGSFYTPTSVLEWIASKFSIELVTSWLAVTSLLSWGLVMSCNKLMTGKLCASIIMIEVACIALNAGYVYLPDSLSDTIYSIRPLFVQCAFIMQLIIIAISTGGRAIGKSNRNSPRNTGNDPGDDDYNPFRLSGGEAVAQ